MRKFKTLKTIKIRFNLLNKVMGRDINAGKNSEL